MRVIRVLSEDTHWSGKLVSNKCPLEVMREPSSIIKQQSVSLASFPADQLVLRCSIVLFILSAQCPLVFQRLCKVSDCFVRYRVAAANCALGAFSFLVSSLPVAVDLVSTAKMDSACCPGRRIKQGTAESSLFSSHNGTVCGSDVMDPGWLSWAQGVHGKEHQGGWMERWSFSSRGAVLLLWLQSLKSSPWNWLLKTGCSRDVAFAACLSAGSKVRPHL